MPSCDGSGNCNCTCNVKSEKSDLSVENLGKYIERVFKDKDNTIKVLNERIKKLERELKETNKNEQVNNDYKEILKKLIKEVSTESTEKAEKGS